MRKYLGESNEWISKVIKGQCGREITGVDASNVSIASFGLVVHSHCWIGTAMRIKLSHDYSHSIEWRICRIKTILNLWGLKWAKD